MTKLLALVEMQGSSTEEKLFKLLDDLLFSSRASEKRTFNFMGIATDKASNMISKRNAGLKNRLKEKHPHIYVVHDLCHAFNLILQDCFKVFPQEYRNIIDDVSSTFSRSSRNSAKLKAIMATRAIEDPRSKVHAIKRYVKTRWTSFRDTVERIVVQADSLREYF